MRTLIALVLVAGCSSDGGNATADASKSTDDMMIPMPDAAPALGTVR